MNSSAHAHTSSRPRPSPRPSPQHNAHYNSSYRPATIAELANRARDDQWDTSKGVKFWLKAGDAHRRAGQRYLDANDLENAFVEFAKAATLVLEKLPSHREYYTTLNADQRHNLGLNGQDILDSLSALKPTLVEHHERWVAQHPADDTTQPRPVPSLSIPNPVNANARRVDSVRRPDDPRAQEDDSRDRARQAEVAAHREEQSRYENQRRVDAMNEDARRKVQEAAQREGYENQRRVDAVNEDARRKVQEELDRKQREDIEKRRREIARREEEQRIRESNDVDGRRTKEEAAAAATAGSRRMAVAPGQQDPNRYGTAQNDAGGSANAINPEAQRRQQEFDRQQAEMKRREEEIIRTKRQADIARRQEEAEAAARAARQNLAPPPSQYTAPRSIGPSRIPSFPDTEAPLPMPLESPTRHDDGYSTDRESVTDEAPWHRSRQQSGTPTRGPSYPPPVTTTSPAPGSAPIRYPALMSQHQLKQGYTPSLQSMFINPGGKSFGSASMLFVPDSSSSSTSLYPSNALPRPSQPSQYPYGPPAPQQGTSPSPYRGYPGPTRNAPEPPVSVPIHEDPSRITYPANPKARADPVVVELKNVSVPRDCLSKFVSIAALNTSRNRETCGLLLGKDKGHKFIVTTLLIPKQHSTSDTCTMDEEELVMMFTEERSLITLGWIHTHPSQSCFMSSVDLHTHSGFQRMLPESFAVVCAPSSTPNFGIFRLTEPPGLQTILQCTAKEAFHPHPDVPIYTDADKGHVQIRDLPLEIVDLRS